MGGGFGGNILALTRDNNVASLIKRVQATYYEPQRRQGVLDGAVMISTPGDGLANVDLESVWRGAIEQFNSSTYRVEEFRSKLTHLLDNIQLDATTEEVWPVIVAAGKGTRARATGLAVPKPLAPVLGEAAIVHVLRNIRAALGITRPPIVIISPETESDVRAALAGETVTFVLQPEALGTGDAVLCAHEQLKDFRGRTLIVWSTQPVIRPETILRTLRLAALFNSCAMVVPTAYQDHPYAPLLRDELGRVREARETRLEAERPGAGESNIGLFLLQNEPMLAALAELKQRYWNPLERRYRRNAGELGFPNELINYFASLNASVFASPIADSREEQGIKNLQDVARCEQFILELQQENS
jgi:bifunctional N-acetylglucosamine-1-phosphate-uridyltransferase/glucosamine-1-phosphate-acetyltransferase GlmU-like protein